MATLQVSLGEAFRMLAGSSRKEVFGGLEMVNPLKLGKIIGFLCKTGSKFGVLNLWVMISLM